MEKVSRPFQGTLTLLRRIIEAIKRNKTKLVTALTMETIMVMMTTTTMTMTTMMTTMMMMMMMMMMTTTTTMTMTV